MTIGDDVTLTVGKTPFAVRRKHVIAEIKPATRTRVDLGLAIEDAPITGRLIDTGGLAKGNRITRRIPITAVAEIGAEVKRWLKRAYAMDA